MYLKYISITDFSGITLMRDPTITTHAYEFGGEHTVFVMIREAKDGYFNTVKPLTNMIYNGVILGAGSYYYYRGPEILSFTNPIVTPIT